LRRKISSSKLSEYWTEEHLKFAENIAVKLMRGVEDI
jgi:hypothetical protein